MKNDALLNIHQNEKNQSKKKIRMNNFLKKKSQNEKPHTLKKVARKNEKPQHPRKKWQNE